MPTASFVTTLMGSSKDNYAVANRKLGDNVQHLAMCPVIFHNQQFMCSLFSYQALWNSYCSYYMFHGKSFAVTNQTVKTGTFPL